MSVKALSCAMALRNVSPSEKLLLLALANYADEHMRCYPSQARLAEDTCLSDRTIRTLLAALEDRKMLSRRERLRTDGSRASDLFTLHFAAEVLADGMTPISGGTETTSGGVGKQLPGGGEATSALTTFEPSVNRQSEPTRAKRASASEKFEDWYSGYPHKVGRADAVRAFAKALAKTDLDALKLGLARYLRTKPADHNWCNPATWLNQERWLDEPSAGTGVPTNLAPSTRVRATPEGLTDEQLRTLAHQQAAALGRSSPANPLDS